MKIIKFQKHTYYIILLFPLLICVILFKWRRLIYLPMSYNIIHNIQSVARLKLVLREEEITTL